MKKASHQSDEEGAGPSSEPPRSPHHVTEDANLYGVAAAALPHGPLTDVAPPFARGNAVGVPSPAVASAADTWPRMPPVIRPAIVRPVGAAVVPAMAPLTDPIADNQASSSGQASTVEATVPSAAQTDMSSAAAVQRVRQRMAESHERRQKLKEEQENECVICLDRPMSTVLQPCGHVQMARSRCCKKLLALAKSKGVEPLVRGQVLTTHERCLFQHSPHCMVRSAPPAASRSRTSCG